MSQSSLRRPLQPELLESRTHLSGNVTARVVGQDLVLMGDAADNVIVLSADPAPSGQLLVEALNGTVNGGPRALIDRPFKHARIILRGGDNSLLIHDVRLNATLAISTGEGADIIRLLNTRVAGALSINARGGDDTIDLSGVAVSGKVVIHTKAGADVITADSSRFDQDFDLVSAGGDDSILLGRSRFQHARGINAGSGHNLIAPRVVSLSYDFSRGAQGWKSGFADYSSAQRRGIEASAGIRRLPSELGPGTGFLLSGKNISDDLFMFLTRQLGPRDGLLPDQSYQVRFTIRFASSAPSGAVGVGGAPGESVWLKAGATGRRPGTKLEGNLVVANFDHGQQAVGGTAASVISDIANGNTNLNSPYVSLLREHLHTYTVRTDARGRLYLVVGTDSGFESTTALYYQKIDVQLIPVTRDSQEKPPQPRIPPNPDDNPQ